MRNKINWIIVKTFDTFVSLEEYLLGLPKSRTLHSNLSKCTLCDDVEEHEMRNQYRNCVDSECNNQCNARYLIQTCFKSNRVILKSHQGHQFKQNDNNNNNNEKKIKIKHQGISLKFKLAIKKYIYEKNISMPLKIFKNLVLDFKELSINELPCLIQIQNYTKYLRLKNGDVNSLEGLKEHLYGKSFEEVNMSLDHEPFYFGIELGDGSDASHFHLGITTKNLLKNIEICGMFHLDCTYKVLKYGFPLIVYGVTDITRKFHPISFMITSHEQENDFTHFWKSMLLVCSQFNVNLKCDMQYICIDASRSMYNSIEKNFPDTTSIMCWFHIRKNVYLFKTISLN